MRDQANERLSDHYRDQVKRDKELVSNALEVEERSGRDRAAPVLKDLVGHENLLQRRNGETPLAHEFAEQKYKSSCRKSQALVNVSGASRRWA